jgi:tricarballylate dehydrogenase
VRPLDVVVVGSGNAALCAAIAATEAGAAVCVLEAGGEDHFGGNSRYTAGAMRFAYDGADDLLVLLGARDDPRIAASDFGSYPRQRFAADLKRADPDDVLDPLQAHLIDHSYDTMAWLVRAGLRVAPIFERQSFFRAGRYRFWGGLTLAVEGEGEGLVTAERDIALRGGAELRLRQRVVDLVVSGSRIAGVALADGTQIDARAVVLACGGFEADEALRAEHLGAEWRSAVVRGSPYNRGDGLRMALGHGAGRHGDYGACHAVCMDVATPSFETSTLPHRERKNFRKISYPFGVMLNARGERFVDEGADFRNYTYAQYGREVLRQPGGFAWQLFDAQAAELLYEEYRMPDATRVEADTLEALVEKLEGVDARRALATLRSYNGALADSGRFDPTQKDGCATTGISPPKSNWARPLHSAPFRAYRVTCGVTFTYGGLRVDTEAAVLREDGSVIEGLFAAGEIVGGLFGGAYPGGSGLTAGAVFGRAAGGSAARSARQARG